jgi:hypothetical protein
MHGKFLNTGPALRKKEEEECVQTMNRLMHQDV